MSVPKTDANTGGFEVAVIWYAPADEALKKWTKRVMILELKKTMILLRELTKEDLRIIAMIKSIAGSLSISAASQEKVGSRGRSQSPQGGRWGWLT